MCLLELPGKSEILAVDLRELLRGRIDVLEVPLELIFKLHRANDDVHLSRRNEVNRRCSVIFEERDDHVP